MRNRRYGEGVYEWDGHRRSIIHQLRRNGDFHGNWRFIRCHKTLPKVEKAHSED